MAARWDAKIVGGGHTGLACGAYLARAGLKVLVLERRPIVGGADVTEAFAPGFRASTFAFIMGHLHPKVIAELELHRHGLRSVEADNVISPTDDGDRIVFSKDPVKTHAQIARVSRRDADNSPKFFAHLSARVDLLRRLQLEAPVDPARRDLRGLIDPVRFALRYRGAAREVQRLIETLSLSAHESVARWFDTPLVRAKLMHWVTIGRTVGP